MLFDNGTPAPLRYALKGHIVVEAMERGWDRFVNGELIAVAESAGFEVLLTTDKNMRYQQNLTGRKIAFVVVGNQQWPTLRRHVDRVVAAVNAATPGSYVEVEIPFKARTEQKWFEMTSLPRHFSLICLAGWALVLSTRFAPAYRTSPGRPIRSGASLLLSS